MPYAAVAAAAVLFAGATYMFHVSRKPADGRMNISIAPASNTASAVSVPITLLEPPVEQLIEQLAVEPTEPPSPAEPDIYIPPVIEEDSSIEFNRFVQGLEYRDTRLIALNAMLRAWNREDGPDPATSGLPSGLYETAAQYGLHCYDMRANMSKLRVLNLPCVLQIFLPGDDRRPFYLTLMHLDDDKASIVVNHDGDVQQFDIAVLERYWYGRAFVFWEEFEPLDPLMTLGSTGPSVAWLQNELAQLGYYSSAVTAVYDESTARSVALFQRRYRLLADAKFGPETRMALYGASGRYAVPSLVSNSRLVVAEDSES
jgi:hypothetical protein